MKLESKKVKKVKEGKIYLKVSITIIICVVIAILATSSILYVNFQSILMKHEYETNLDKMKSEEIQRLQFSNIALNTLYQIYNDISVIKLLTFENISPIEESAAFLQSRYFLVTMPNVDSIYVYNMKSNRIYDVSNESELIRPWNADYYTKANFYDACAVDMIENCIDYVPFIAVPRYYQVNKNTTKCVYTYIMYDIFKNGDERSVVMLNLDSEYLFQTKESDDPDTVSLVVDKTGKVIYSNSREFKVLDNVNKDFDNDDIMSKEKSGYFLSEISGVKSVVIFTDTDKYGWRYINIINYNNLLSQVNKLRSATIVITILIACIGLIITFICSYRLSAQIRVMSKDIKTLQSEKRQTETITKRTRLKELLENGGARQKSGSQLLTLLEIPFSKDQKLMLLCMNVDNYQYLLETTNSKVINAYNFAAVNILNELLGEGIYTCCLELKLDKTLIFIVADSEVTREFLDAHITHMQELVNEYFQVSMSIVLSDFVEDPNKLFYQYEQIEETLSRSIFWEKGSILHCSDIKTNAVQNYEYPEKSEKQLMEYLTYGKAKEANEIYLSIVTQTYHYPVVIYNMVISRLIFMINNVVNLITKNSSRRTLTSSIVLINLLQEADTIEERNRKFQELFDQIQKDLENKRNDKLSQIISVINLKIEKEYMNPLLSIETMAEEVGMSAAYICRIYKKYAGKRLGIWGSSVISLITILLFILIKSIRIIDTTQILEVLKLEAQKEGLNSSYSTFNILSFVHRSGYGEQGFFAMVLFAVTIVTIVLNMMYVYKAQKCIVGKSNIKIYEVGQYAMVFNIILSLLVISFSRYSNKTLGLVNAFSYSRVLILIAAFSIGGFVLIKIMEAPERRIYKEPGFLKELRKNWVLFILLLPTIVYFAINSYLPMAGIYFAFEKFNFRDGLWTSPFVMFDNFEYIWKADLLKLVKNTVLYNLVFIILGHILKIFIAILISKLSCKWFKRLNQTLIFMPHFVSYVLLSVIVYNALTYETGAVNTFLTSIGLNRIDFYNTPGYWPFIIVFFELWKGVGYGSVVYLAAILGIDKTYYEAAEVDGANVFQQIRYITLPLLKPTFIILVLFSLGNIMRGQFDLFYQVVGNNGLLFNTTDIFDTYVYRLTMTNPLNNGLGTAAGLFQSIFGFIVILITNYLVKRKNEDYSLF